MIQFFSVYNIIHWDRKKEAVRKPADLCKETTTGALVFSVEQENSMDTAIKALKDNVLFVAPKAVNLNHGEEPRNTLVLFKIPNEWRQ